MTNKETRNPLLCDPESGICEIPGSPADVEMSIAEKQIKPIKIIYYTDPICSSCWGIEPQLRKLKLEYGEYIEIDYRMGGLLPDWSYNSGGISKPSDVAHHWDEVSLHYDMPIDGDVWLEDPLDSSFPPSIAFKAAQLQDKNMAILFLREIREMLFLQKKNITRWEHLASAAEKIGLDVGRLQNDYEGKANALFQDDLNLARQLGVTGFPTMFFVNGEGNQEKVYGTKLYTSYENVLKALLPSATNTYIDPDWRNLFSKYPTLTSREYAELSGFDRRECEDHLQQLVALGHLSKMVSKNGFLWIRR